MEDISFTMCTYTSTGTNFLFHSLSLFLLAFLYNFFSYFLILLYIYICMLFCIIHFWLSHYMCTIFLFTTYSFHICYIIFIDFLLNNFFCYLNHKFFILRYFSTSLINFFFSIPMLNYFFNSKIFFFLHSRSRIKKIDWTCWRLKNNLKWFWYSNISIQIMQAR